MIIMQCPFVCYEQVSDCPHLNEGVCVGFERNADQGDAWCTQMVGYAIYHLELEQAERRGNHPAM